MNRQCTRCQRSFTPKDLSREDSRNLEAERKASGLQGVRFVYYRCPTCEMNDIFVDILPLENEFHEDFEKRRQAMEAVVRHLHAEDMEAVVMVVEK